MCFMKRLFCLLLLAVNLSHAEASLPALTAEHWRQDLDFFANEITTKHRDPFHFISKTEFDQAVSHLRQRIPSMKDYEVVAGLQHLAALIGLVSEISAGGLLVWQRFAGSPCRS